MPSDRLSLSEVPVADTQSQDPFMYPLLRPLHKAVGGWSSSAHLQPLARLVTLSALGLWTPSCS